MLRLLEKTSVLGFLLSLALVVLFNVAINFCFKMNPLISVIVAVHDAELTIGECVDSILTQTYTHIQVILVDDGSPDNAGTICDQLADGDDRVVAIHQANQGAMAARKRGVEASVGDYVCFVDADDCIKEDALASMCSYMQENVDVVVFESEVNDCYNRIEYANALLKFRYWNLWGKLFRRELLDDYVMSVPRQFKVGEDFLCNLRMLSRISRTVVTKPIRKYIYNENNPKSVQKNHIYDYEYERMMIIEVKDTLENNDFFNEIKSSFLRWETCYLVGMIGYRYNVDYEEKWIKDFLKDCKGQKLGFRCILVKIAIRYKAFRWLFVLEKSLKTIARKVLK